VFRLTLPWRVGGTVTASPLSLEPDDPAVPDDPAPVDDSAAGPSSESLHA
jgi:hypothetical protein